MKNYPSKRPRVGETPAPAGKIGRVENHLNDAAADGEVKGGGGGGGRAAIALHPWHQPSSRIYRVSRATGGKDRHSKVYTAKGLRDRRVRLSVSTAIQFYDLQDRLGVDQPSKAIEWLIKSAAAAIAELPTLETNFPDYPITTEKHEAGLAVLPDEAQHQVSKSGCSSTSETSKGSVLSLSRSESRIKARERARERAAKEKDFDLDDGDHVTIAAHNSTTINSQGSFTELLTGNNGEHKPTRYMPVTATADYFSQALFGQEQKAASPLGMMQFNIGSTAAGDHPEMQYSFSQEHPVPITSVGPGGGYNLNFTGLNRGTLQSNLPFQLPHQHLQRLSSSVDGSNLPFFLGQATAATSAGNQFPAGFDGRLQLCYGDEYRQSDFKGKGKS